MRSASPHGPDRRFLAVRFAVLGDPLLADVFSLDRGYLGTIALGAVRPIMFRPDGALVSLEGDAIEEPRIVLYRVHGLP